jgi:hypothetical protein
MLIGNTKRGTRRGFGLLAVVGAVAAVALVSAEPAQAVVVSQLVATPSSVNVAVGASQNVTVKLNSGCPNALGTGLTYSVAVGTFNGAIVSVTGTSGSYHCTTATGASFQFTGIACGTTSVRFDPVVGNRGGRTRRASRTSSPAPRSR